MKLIIAGSRTFNDYHTLKINVSSFIIDNGKYPDIEIVSGGASGADSLGERYAKEYDLPVKIFPADWAKHGKKAGYLRNAQMAEYATHCLCFWDGKSKGTEIMIKQARRRNLVVEIITIQ